ncbi:MAG: creatininase family protein [Rhizobiaceae bacterium]
MSVDQAKTAPTWVSGLKALEADSVTEATIFVLPLGATEQHGKHLPRETDWLIARGVCERLIATLDKKTDVRFLPVEQVGYSLEHMDHEGSQSLSYDDAVSRWVGIGEALTNNGVRRLILLNAHGGNSPIMSIVAQELRVRCSMLAVTTSWTRFVKNSGIVSQAEEDFGIHGGDIETSVMLALHPDLVNLEEARDYPNLQEILAVDFQHLRAYGPHAFGWKAADLNRLGVTGNAGLASAEKGEALIELAVRGLADLIDDVQKFDLSLLHDA